MAAEGARIDFMVLPPYPAAGSATEWPLCTGFQHVTSHLGVGGHAKKHMKMKKKMDWRQHVLTNVTLLFYECGFSGGDTMR